MNVRNAIAQGDRGIYIGGSVVDVSLRLSAKVYIQVIFEFGSRCSARPTITATRGTAYPSNRLHLCGVFIPTFLPTPLTSVNELFKTKSSFHRSEPCLRGLRIVEPLECSPQPHSHCSFSISFVPSIGLEG